MALDYPSNPTNGQTFTDPATGIVWVFDGVKWRSGAGGGAYLPLSGGTLTGPLAGATGAFSGVVSGADPPAGDSSGKLATTAWINNNRPQNRNRIINGSFMVDQYNGHNGVAMANNPQYACDRWAVLSNPASKLVAGSGAFAGGANIPISYCSFAQTSASYTPTATDYYFLSQTIEFCNIGDFLWGTPDAHPVTLSFWASATNGGIYSGSIRQFLGVRSYPFTFTLPIAVWTKFSITIPGDTTGPWAVAANAGGLTLSFDYGCGSNWRSTANTWQNGNFIGVTGSASLVSQANGLLNIANVQLELGSQATPFDWRPYGEELALCQRYYQLTTVSARGPATSVGQFFNGNASYHPMRALPTASLISVASSANASTRAFSAYANNSGRFEIQSAAAGDTYNIGVVYSLDAEL